LHSDPKQASTLPGTVGIQGKLILTEAQFNLVKKVYPKCFHAGGRFSLNESSLVFQFFLNLKAFYDMLYKPQAQSRPSTA
jgi:hypothetical protein